MIYSLHFIFFSPSLKQVGRNRVEDGGRGKNFWVLDTKFFLNVKGVFRTRDSVVGKN